MGGEGFLTPETDDDDDDAAGLVEPNEGAREALARAGVVAGVLPAVFSLVAERAGETVVFRPKEEVEEMVVRAFAVDEARGRVEGGGAMDAMDALFNREPIEAGAERGQYEDRSRTRDRTFMRTDRRAAAPVVIVAGVDFTEGAARTVDEAAARGADVAEWVVGRVVVETKGFRRGMGPVEEVEEVVDGFAVVEGRAEVVLPAGTAALVGPAEEEKERDGQFRYPRAQSRENEADSGIKQQAKRSGRKTRSYGVQPL